MKRYNYFRFVIGITLLVIAIMCIGCGQPTQNPLTDLYESLQLYTEMSQRAELLIETSQAMIVELNIALQDPDIDGPTARRIRQALIEAEGVLDTTLAGKLILDILVDQVKLAIEIIEAG